MVLCIVVPMILHGATGGYTNERNPWWSTANIVVAGAAYAGVIASLRRQLFGMVLWLFTYIFMGLAPYVQYRFGMTPTTTPHTDVFLFPAAGLLVLFSSIAVLVGSALAGRSHRTLGEAVQRYVDPRRANLLFLAGLAIFAYYASKVGPASFLLGRHEHYEVRALAWPEASTATLVTGAMQMTLLVGFIAQMHVRQQRRALGLRPRLWPALVNGLVLLYAVNPISSPRYVFGTVALAVLATLGVYATLRRFRIMAAVAIVGMLVAFPLADLFRYSTDTTLEVETPVEALTSGDFDAFVQLTNTLSYVQDHGITWGYQLLGVPLLWVPRNLWEAKPRDTGIVLADYMKYDFSNLSAPIWTELLINFGVVGVVLGMGVLGYFFKRWDTLTDLHLRFSVMPPLLVCSTAFYLMIFLRGSMIAVSAYLLVIVATSAFVVRRKRIGVTSGYAGTPHLSLPESITVLSRPQ
ncbi:hypothetical protein ACT4S5_12375 [Kocuria oceani]|uniref:hypothetical protein n=1 Tax=Kocuria oceani TaxID=988827 RepID=UPI004035815A